MLLPYNYFQTFQNSPSQNLFFSAMFWISCWSQTYSAAVWSPVCHKETSLSTHTGTMSFAGHVITSRPRSLPHMDGFRPVRHLKNL